MKSHGGSDSSSGSDSVASVATHGKFPPPRCFCNINAIAYTSKTLRNPNRAFYGCPYFKEKKPYCKFFKWVDEYEKKMMAISETQEGKIAQLMAIFNPFL